MKLLNYLKIAVRNIFKQKAFSFINIAGLAVGLASTILIMLFVLFELSYDNFHPKSDRIYRISREFLNKDGSTNLHLARLAPPFAPLLKNDYPDMIEDIVRVRSIYDELFYTGEKRFVEENAYFVEPELFRIFDYKLIKGDPGSALSEPFQTVLTKTTAERYFGNDNPVGKTIKTEDGSELMVTGIIEDSPQNTHFKFDMLVSFATWMKFVSDPDGFMTNWGSNNYVTYALLAENVKPASLSQQFPGFLDRHMGPIYEQYGITGFTPSDVNRLHLWNIEDIHLHSHLTTELETNGSITDVYIFSAVALFILLIACINFMNLATARAAKRAREIGIRKVVGSSKKDLIIQFISESVFVTLIALVFAVLLVELALPFFNTILGKDLTLLGGDISILLYLVVFAVFVGIFAGSYPAFYLSAFRPVKVLKGEESRAKGGAVFRKILVTFQFAVSIVLIIGLLVIFEQMQYMKNKETGVNKDQIVVVPVDGDMLEKRETIRSKLLSHNAIESVTFSKFVPSDMLLDSYGGKRIDSEGDEQQLEFRIAVIPADYDFIDTYKINIIAGRNFSREFATDDTAAFIINELAAEKLGWKTPDDAVSKPLIYGSRKGNIIGVVENFNFESLHYSVQPMIILIRDDNTWNASIKINEAETAAALGFIEELWKEYRPLYPFEYEFLDKQYGELYASERRLGKLITYFAVLAIIIACLGLFGLASYTAQQRRKEVGIRKTLGASVRSIVALISKEFVMLVLIANIIAWPLSWYFLDKWLGEFAYSIDIHFYVFIIAGFTAFIIALLTVAYQALKAAVVNPVNTIKYE